MLVSSIGVGIGIGIVLIKWGSAYHHSKSLLNYITPFFPAGFRTGGRVPFVRGNKRNQKCLDAYVSLTPLRSVAVELRAPKLALQTATAFPSLQSVLH
jgi:hypothetical protein